MRALAFAFVVAALLLGTVVDGCTHEQVNWTTLSAPVTIVGTAVYQLDFITGTSTNGAGGRLLGCSNTSIPGQVGVLVSLHGANLRVNITTTIHYAVTGAGCPTGTPSADFYLINVATGTKIDHLHLSFTGGTFMQAQFFSTHVYNANACISPEVAGFHAACTVHLTVTASEFAETCY